MSFEEHIACYITTILISILIGTSLMSSHFEKLFQNSGIEDVKRCSELKDGKFKIEWCEIIVTSNAIIKIKDKK